MKNLLSQVCLGAWAGGIRIEDIINNIIHALLIRLQHLHLLFHQPCLLKQERLRNSVAIGRGLELCAHFIKKSIHFLVSNCFQLSLMMLNDLLRG